ncbi:MAG: cytochrome c [Ideonella sp.]|nr:cytochrome c [Ideonella sp.]
MKSWLAIALGSWALALGAQAQTVPLFEGADLKLGESLIRTHNCSACHGRLMNGPGDDTYNPKGRINTPSALRGMVDMCATQLNLQLFPEEVTAVAAVLNRDHYRFGTKP